MRGEEKSEWCSCGLLMGLSISVSDHQSYKLNAHITTLAEGRESLKTEEGSLCFRFRFWEPPLSRHLNA